MTVKRRAHHNLAAVQAKFASADMLEMTTSAFRSAEALGIGREEVVDAVQALSRSDFVNPKRRTVRQIIAVGTTRTRAGRVTITSTSSSPVRR